MPLKFMFYTISGCKIRIAKNLIIHEQVSQYIFPSQINLIFTKYANIYSLKLKTVAKNFSIRLDGGNNTKNFSKLISSVVS